MASHVLLTLLVIGATLMSAHASAADPAAELHEAKNKLAAIDIAMKADPTLRRAMQAALSRTTTCSSDSPGGECVATKKDEAVRENSKANNLGEATGFGVYDAGYRCSQYLSGWTFSTCDTKLAAGGQKTDVTTFQTALGNHKFAVGMYGVIETENPGLDRSVICGCRETVVELSPTSVTSCDGLLGPWWCPLGYVNSGNTGTPWQSKAMIVGCKQWVNWNSATNTGTVHSDWRDDCASTPPNLAWFG